MVQELVLIISGLQSTQHYETLSGIFDASITDHLPIFTVVNCSPDMNREVIKFFRDHSPLRLRQLRDSVAGVLDFAFSCGISDIDTTIVCFMEIISTLYNRCCPVRSKRITKNKLSKPYISKGLLLSINRKHALYKDYKNGSISFDMYKIYRNNVTSEMRRAKNDYYQNRFSECSDNSRTTWATIKSLMGSSSKTKSCNPNFNNFTGANVTNNSDLCNHMNDYFSMIGANLSNTVDVGNVDPLEFMGNQNENSFFIHPCSELEVGRVIKSVADKCSISDTVPVFIYKILNDIISPYIALFFNLSVEEGKFPTPLKTAKVVPIFKSGDPSVCSNYRPVSVLNMLSKIFEKLMHRRLNSFIAKYKLIGENQFGFRKSRSTGDAVVEFLNDVNGSLENKKYFVTVCIDLSKAFDTVHHGVLIDKLRHLGIRGIALQWFQSYLGDRLQYVSIDGIHSQCRRVQSGVPQGSVLGPTIFNLYTCEISNVCSDLKCVNYADDTTLYLSHSNLRTLINTFNYSLCNLDRWFKGNRLVLNANKTNCMLINNVNVESLSPVIIDDTPINWVDKIKFLGVIIDNKLNFKEHVNTISSRISRSIGVIRRINNQLTNSVLLKLYYSLIYSHMTYGILAWGNSSNFNVNRISRIQARFFKILTVRGCTDPIVVYKLLPFSKVYEYSILIKLYKCFMQNNHNYFNAAISNLLPDHSYSTRFSVTAKLLIPNHRLTSTHRSFIISAIYVWNSIPDNLKQISSLKTFKYKVKDYLLL